MTDLSRSLELIVKDLDVKFTLKGTKIAHKEMCAPNGLLPGLARRADQLSSLCLGYGLGIKIDDEDQSLLGYKVSFDEFTPNALRVFCIVDILFEIIKMSPTRSEVSLDELMYD